MPIRNMGARKTDKRRRIYYGDAVSFQNVRTVLRCHKCDKVGCLRLPTSATHCIDNAVCGEAAGGCGRLTRLIWYHRDMLLVAPFLSVLREHGHEELLNRLRFAEPQVTGHLGAPQESASVSASDDE